GSRGIPPCSDTHENSKVQNQQGYDSQVIQLFLTIPANCAVLHTHSTLSSDAASTIDWCARLYKIRNPFALLSRNCKGLPFSNAPSRTAFVGSRSLPKSSGDQ